MQSALPFFHAFANNEVLNAAMVAGGAVIPRLSFDTVDFLGAVERHRPDEIVTVPTMVVALCEEAGATSYDTNFVTGLMSAGSVASSWMRSSEDNVPSSRIANRASWLGESLAT